RHRPAAGLVDSAAVPPSSVGEDLTPRPNLAELATRINQEHRQAEQALLSGLEHARKAGDLLQEAKDRVEQGKWQAWQQANLTCSTSLIYVAYCSSCHRLWVRRPSTAHNWPRWSRLTYSARTQRR